MPTYEFACARGHQEERLRKYRYRDRPVRCYICGGRMRRGISAPHVPPDGVYSHTPNIGSPDRFERQLEATRAHQKVIDR